MKRQFWNKVLVYYALKLPEMEFLLKGESVTPGV